MSDQVLEIVFPAPPQSKAELLERIHQAHAALTQTISRLTPAQIVARPSEDGWSVKDILAHVAMWERVLVRFHLRHQPFDVALEIEGAQFGVTHEDELNERIYRRYRDHSWEEVVSFFGESHRELLDALAELAEAELFGRPAPAGEPLIHHVIWNTYEHSIEHVAMIRALVSATGQLQNLNDVKQLAAEIDAEIRALPVPNTHSERAVRRDYSRKLRQTRPEFILDLARELFGSYGHRWLAYELIQSHRAASRSMGEAELEEFGRGIDSWWTVDAFARTLAGPAWLRGQVPDRLIQNWARSKDPWWRRAALVSTVALNVRSQGGKGDVARTLEVCRLLADDHQDMVAKAMSWALRELVVHDPQAVREFLSGHEDVLAARVKREVRHKLAIGLKNPRRKRG